MLLIGTQKCNFSDMWVKHSITAIFAEFHLGVFICAFKSLKLHLNHLYVKIIKVATEQYNMFIWNMQIFIIQTSLGEICGLFHYWLNFLPLIAHWAILCMYLIYMNIPLYYSMCVVALMMRELLRRRAVKVLCLNFTTEAGDIHLARRGRGGVCTRAEGMTSTLWGPQCIL